MWQATVLKGPDREVVVSVQSSLGLMATYEDLLAVTGFAIRNMIETQEKAREPVEKAQ